MNEADVKTSKGQQDKGQDLTITIVNEDNGREYPIHSGKGTPIRTIIEHMYKGLKVKPAQGDRLRCEESGEDVFAFREMHLRDYLAAGHCPDLVWLFAGEAGGA